MNNEKLHSDYLPKKTKQQWLVEALAHYKANHYKTTISACNQALILDPNYDRAHHGKGLAFYMLGQFEEALTALTRAIQCNPNNSKAYICKGKAYYALEHYKEALEAYEKAVQIDPNNHEALNCKKAILDKHINMPKEDLIDKDPLITDIFADDILIKDLIVENETPHHYVIKGDDLREHLHLEEALEAYEKALQVDPNNRKALSGKGKTLRQLGRYTDASKVFQAATGRVGKLLPYSQTHGDGSHPFAHFRNYDD